MADPQEGYDKAASILEQLQKAAGPNKPYTFAGRVLTGKQTPQQVLSKSPAGDVSEAANMQMPLAAAAPVVGAANTAYEGWLSKVSKRLAQESTGQAILDEMEAAGISPQSVAEKFWRSTYYRLPGDVQAKFQRYVTNLTQMKPGDVVAAGPGGKKIIANSWEEILPHTEFPQSVEHLEGTERGLIALMDEANRRFAQQAIK